MYQLSNITSSIHRLTDGAWIPIDIENKDYIVYLEWLAAGNIPLPPDDMVINKPEPSVLEQAVILLLKLSNPTDLADISAKNDLLNTLNTK